MWKFWKQPSRAGARQDRRERAPRSASGCRGRSTGCESRGGASMALTESDFERRARFTYELGRLSWAAQMLLFVGPLLVVARLIDRPMSLIVPVGTALVLLATGLTFVHLRYKRAALSGMAAGMPALLLPWIFRFGGEICVVDRCFDLCLPSSLAAGALA